MVPILKKFNDLIIVTGESVFIGSRVAKKIISDTIATKSKIRCITRNTDLLPSYLQEGNGRLEIVYADVQNYSDLIRVM